MSDPTVLPRLPAVRGAAPRSTSWWGRAFVRSLEEAAFGEADLAAARALARSGRLGAVMVIASMASAVVDGRGRAAGPAESRVVAQLKVAPLADWDGLVTEAAREAGFVAALEAGQLPAELLEHADQAGIELLPAAADLETGCGCDAWTQPCRHALALAYQLAWQMDRDPYVLLLLRGRTREWLIEEVQRRLVAASRDLSQDALRLRPQGDDERLDAAGVAADVLALAQDAPVGEGLHAAAVAAYDERIAALLDREVRAER